MGPMNTESNQTSFAPSTSDYNGLSVHAPTFRSEKVGFNSESSQTSSSAAHTSNGNGWSPHSVSASSDQTSPAAATSNFYGLSTNSTNDSSEKVDPFSLNTESSQIYSAAATSNVNGLTSTQSPTANSEKVSSAVVTSNVNALSANFPTASSEKIDPVDLNTESNQSTSSATATSNANGLSEKGNQFGLNNESNQTCSAAAAAATSNVNAVKIHSPTSSSEKPIGPSSKFSSFSSGASSPDSTLDDPFIELDIEHEVSTSTTTSVPKHSELQFPQASENVKKTSSDHHIPMSTLEPAVTSYQHTPKSGTGHVFESPPTTQVMERCNKSKYRIPSSVFARNKSTHPDWSVASNESLFSIRTSFAGDRYNYFMSLSGELKLNDEPCTSGQKLSSSPEAQATTGGKATDNGHWGRSQELGLGSVGNMKGSGLTENAEDQSLEKSNTEGRISHYSVESNSSTKSFAFPVLENKANVKHHGKLSILFRKITYGSHFSRQAASLLEFQRLAGDKDKNISARMGNSMKLGPETPKSPQQPKIEERQPSSKTEEPNSEPKTPATTSLAHPARWFSCFPCCS